MQMAVAHHAKDTSLTPVLNIESNMLLTNIKLVSPLNEMYRCPECNYMSPSMDGFKKHMQNAHPITKDAVCRICHKRYKTMKSLRRHEKTHLNVPVTVKVKEPELLCPQCPKRFSTKTALHWHVERNHTNKEKTSTCQVCGKELADHALLKRHLEMMHSLENATCTICNKTFKSVINLQRHMAVTHPPELAEQMCQICKKTFKCSTHLRIHIRTVHAPETVFNCDLCGKGFSLKKYMLKHRKIHVDVKEFQCEICYQVYKSVTDAKRHAKRVHMKTEDVTKTRVHKCHICDKEFTRTKYLFFHKKTHDDKTVACKFCSKLFKCNSHVNKHTKRVHTNTILKKVTDKIFYCDTCKKSFSKKKNLAKHIKTHIFMKKETPCDICNKLFKTNSDVSRHLRKVHMKNMNIKEMIMKNKNMKFMKTNAQAKAKTEETLTTECMDGVFKNIDTENVNTKYTVKALEITEYTNEVPRNVDHKLATLGNAEYTLESTEHILPGNTSIDDIKTLKNTDCIENSDAGTEYAKEDTGKEFSGGIFKNAEFTEPEEALESNEYENNAVDRTNVSDEAETMSEFKEENRENVEGPKILEQVIKSTDSVKPLEPTECDNEAIVDKELKHKLHRHTDIIMAAIECSDFTMEDLGMTEITEQVVLNAEPNASLRDTHLIEAIESMNTKEIPEETKSKEKLRKVDIIKAAIEISDFSMEDLGISEKAVAPEVTKATEKGLTSAGIITVLENTCTTEDIASADFIDALENVDCSEKTPGNTDIIKDAIENSNFTIEDLGLSEFPGDAIASEYTIEDFVIPECTDLIEKALSSTPYVKEDEENTELTKKTIPHTDLIGDIASTEYTNVSTELKDVLETTEYVDQTLENTFFIDALDNSDYTKKVPTKLSKLDATDFIEEALKSTDFIQEALITTEEGDKTKNLIEEARESIEYAQETDDNSKFTIQTDTNTDIIKDANETKFTIDDLEMDAIQSDYTMEEMKNYPDATDVDLKSIEINLLKCLKCGIDFENDVDLHTHLCGGEITLFLDFQEM